MVRKKYSAMAGPAVARDLLLFIREASSVRRL